MDIIDAIHSRRSIRRFKPDPVSREVLEKLLLAGRWSPSGSNTQPWELAILGGTIMEEIKDRIEQKMRTPVKAHPDIPYPPMPEPYASRKKALLKLLNNHRFKPEQNILSDKRKTSRFGPGGFFGAPNAIIVYAEWDICPRSFLGLGMIAQTIALAAPYYWLGTCIMSTVTYWPEIYHESLKIPDSKLIAFGIAIGYPDLEAGVNNFERTREPLEAFVHWHGV